jgi:hypothetical protein
MVFEVFKRSYLEQVATRLVTSTMSAFSPRLRTATVNIVFSVTNSIYLAQY